MDVELLIVDDEVQIRMGIEKGIPWKNFGITKVVTAPNGIEALKILKEEPVRILITDIRMPGMNGLELAQKAKEWDDTIRIVILSGYSEFEYAKRAINIGVVDYLLKPIRLTELTELITRLMDEFHEQEKEQIERQKSLLEDEIVQHILTENLEEDTFQERLEIFTGFGRQTLVLSSLFEFDTREAREISRGEPLLLEKLKTYAQNDHNGFLLTLNQRYLYFTKMDISRSRAEVTAQIRRLHNDINEELRELKIGSVTVGVSQNYPLSQLVTACRECLKQLNHRLYLGTGAMSIYDGSLRREEAPYIMENEERLRQYIIGFHYDKAQDYIADQFQKMKEQKVSSYDMVKGVCLTLKQFLFRHIRETGLDVESVLEKNKTTLLEVPDLFTLDQYQLWISNLYYLVLRGVSEHADQAVSGTVMAAVAYLSTHYHEDITVDFISAYVNKSRNYFSYLFKKEMKVSFTEYLNRYRVEQACRMLDSSTELTIEIAQKVGFRDEKYFSTVFKKIVGCPPSVYRKTKGIEVEEKGVPSGMKKS